MQVEYNASLTTRTGGEKSRGHSLDRDRMLAGCPRTRLRILKGVLLLVSRDLEMLPLSSTSLIRSSPYRKIIGL
jgi:hypothetical protein